MEIKTGIVIFIVFCSVWQGSAASSVNCTEKGPGRFADPDDAICQNYTFCVYDTSRSSYVSNEYQCPTKSVFNPNTAQCTASGNYVCNVTSTNSTTSNSTTGPVCTQDGYIADPDSMKCTTYIECIKIDGMYTKTYSTCPYMTYYNPSTTLCEYGYKCTFKCTTAGRFPVSSDTTCATYYFCVLSSDGTYIQTEYTCLTPSVFSPTAKVCTTSSTCPNATIPVEPGCLIDI